MSNEQKLCEVKIFQLQSMSNAIKCIDLHSRILNSERFALKNSDIALTIVLSNQRGTILLLISARKKAIAGNLQVTYHFFLQIYTNHGLVVKVLAVGRGLGFESRNVLKFPTTPLPIGVALRQSMH